MARRWRGLTFSPPRIAIVVGIAALLIADLALPYFTLAYLDTGSQPVSESARAIRAGSLAGSLDPVYLPGYDISRRASLDLALNVLAAGPFVQWIASVAALVTVAGQFADEINKFLWWPLHLAGYLLIVSPVGLFVGEALLRRGGVAIEAGPSWVVAVVAGIVILVVTFRSHRRLDSYRGI